MMKVKRLMQDFEEKKTRNYEELLKEEESELQKVSLEKKDSKPTGTRGIEAKG
ncbi:hypothetical protein ACE6ED_15750 [Paenibacillus sp. CN-4]|uniref:hypothetical protein n=1 Tax=Paenibacillus nanchangensis TaxID=3348343 RepID=UPI003978F80F